MDGLSCLLAAGARQLIAANAAELLSGPAGLAVWLRTTSSRAPPPGTLPLHIGTATDTIAPSPRPGRIDRPSSSAA